ncbi:hypothetical protein H3143_00720 [Mycoplasma tullyi]|uniref:Lipoprotein n=1 Tax=Mycoplasma tullyi TaxID=1612150 RepID=A0A7D7YIA0_9MOLU|nr:hypothetical protein [Mycoplasma tullyi]QMT98660.1 hypothetical protein H3143_00720 [Mycoplasma tullyi]
MKKKILRSFTLASFLAISLTSCTNETKNQMTSKEVPNNGNVNSNNNQGDNPGNPSSTANGTQGDSSQGSAGMSGINPSSGMNGSNPSGGSTEETTNSELSLKSKAVIASDLVSVDNGAYILNWTKFNTTLSTEQQKASKLMNLDVNDREGMISFDLQVGENQTIKFKQKVDFDFSFLRSLTFGWTDIKSSTTDNSLTLLQNVTNATQLSAYAAPVLTESFNGMNNYYPYLNSWFDVNLTYQSSEKKLEENEVTFEYQLTNTGKSPFFMIKNGSQENQLWSSQKTRVTLSYSTDLANAAKDVMVNKSSELLNKEISYFYDMSTHMVNTEKLEVDARNEGLVKFSDSKYNEQFAITLMQGSAFFNTDTNELTFTVEVKPKDNDQVLSTAITRTFTIMLGKASQQQ